VIIETERLRLRPIGTGDLEELLEVHAQPGVIEFMGPFAREQAIARLEVAEREWSERGHGLMAVHDRGDGRFLGRTGLKWWPQFGETEVGWVLHPGSWGQGYATEAGRACLDWGFRDFELDYVTAMIQPHNARSLAVAARLGMEPLRSDQLGDIPVIVHALRREDWATAT
jgi:RimJ/RimL family protein N-acetyltransferase